MGGLSDSFQTPLDYVEQIGHALWTIIVLLPVALYGFALIPCLVSAFLLAAPREFIDQKWNHRPIDKIIDFLFFMLGGVIVWQIA